METIPKIEPYVTDKGGVVILNGPFPLKQAERVRALCAAAPELLEAARNVLPYLFEGAFHGDIRKDREALEKAISAATEKKEGTR